jgi:hypothetical protein
VSQAPLVTGNRRAPLSERGPDCSETPDVAIKALLRVERLPHAIWEPACGSGNIVRVLRAAGHRDRGKDCASGFLDLDLLLLLCLLRRLW